MQLVDSSSDDGSNEDEDEDDNKIAFRPAPSTPIRDPSPSTLVRDPSPSTLDMNNSNLKEFLIRIIPDMHKKEKKQEEKNKEEKEEEEKKDEEKEEEKKDGKKEGDGEGDAEGEGMGGNKGRRRRKVGLMRKRRGINDKKEGCHEGMVELTSSSVPIQTTRRTKSHFNMASKPL